MYVRRGECEPHRVAVAPKVLKLIIYALSDDPEEQSSVAVKMAVAKINVNCDPWPFSPGEIYFSTSMGQVHCSKTEKTFGYNYGGSFSSYGDWRKGEWRSIPLSRSHLQRQCG
ncbi:MAG: hypothetical protein KIH01_06230 [Candidatus Freyarchaeota archaeon]|nr:hypothetical protein [Candidatus Jordarchaeia archaeon]